MGEELFRRGVPDDRTIWSARALIQERYHDIVRQAHEDFIHAGAQHITTSNYAVTPGVGLTDRIEDLTAVAGRIARQARDRSAQLGRAAVRICGSLPPLVESYRPDLVLPPEQAMRLYARIARALHPSADVFLAETMSSIAEALSAVRGAREVDPDREIWVSWTLGSGGRLRSGEPVVAAADSLIAEGASAILFNCSEPEAIAIALSELQAATDLAARRRAARVRLGAYANRLTPVPADFALAGSTAPQAMRDDLDAPRYADHAERWVALGAELVGGCCGIGPEYIRELARRFSDGGQRLY